MVQFIYKFVSNAFAIMLSFIFVYFAFILLNNIHMLSINMLFITINLIFRFKEVSEI